MIETKARVVLDVLGSPDSELSISLVGDDEIAHFNRMYLHREGPTNVIAFPMQEGPFSEINPGMVGDVVISVDTALKEAEDAGMDVGERFDELLVHGILHLFGYDHENDEAEARIMEAKSREMMDLLRRLDPAVS